MHEALKDNPALQKKVTEEAARLAEGGKADAADALARAVRESLGIELTREELEPLFAKVRELDPERCGAGACLPHRKMAGGRSLFREPPPVF